MEPREQRLVIILADISGYTRFMVENQLSAVHGQQCISFLIETLLREVDIPLELQEIEGDALFLYATRPDDDAAWEHVRAQVRTKLLRFFDVFIEAMVGLGEVTTCPCAICTHLHELKLKIIVHSGRAVFHTIGSRAQISGADVILAHRLLKNSVRSDEYLLMSDPAYREFGRDMGLEFHDGQESYEGFGTIPTHVHLLNAKIDQARDDFFALEPAALKAKTRRYNLAGILGAVIGAARQVRHPSPQSPAGPLRRIFYVPYTAVATPIRLMRASRLAREKIESNRASRAS